MELLPNDKQYLEERDIEYQVIDEGNNLLLILKKQAISPKFNHEKVDVLVKIPMGYPISSMDMFWVNPEIKYNDTGSYPPQADYFENMNGVRWQRFSRHYQWKPTLSLANHLHVVKQILLEERG